MIETVTFPDMTESMSESADDDGSGEGGSGLMSQITGGNEALGSAMGDQSFDDMADMGMDIPAKPLVAYHHCLDQLDDPAQRANACFNRQQLCPGDQLSAHNK